MVTKSTIKARAILMESSTSSTKVGMGTTIIRTTAIIAITITRSVDLLSVAPKPVCVLASFAIAIKYLRYPDEEYMCHSKYYYPLFCHFLQVLFFPLPDRQKPVFQPLPGTVPAAPTTPLQALPGSWPAAGSPL